MGASPSAGVTSADAPLFRHNRSDCSGLRPTVIANAGHGVIHSRRSRRGAELILCAIIPVIASKTPRCDRCARHVRPQPVSADRCSSCPRRGGLTSLITMVVSPPSVRRASSPVTRPTLSTIEIPRDVAPVARIALPASALTQQARRRTSGADGRARPGSARARSGPRRRGEGFVAGKPGWADGAGSGGEGTRGRPPGRCALGEPSASTGRVTLRRGSIAVPISVVFVNLVLSKTGRPCPRRSVVHAAVAAPPAGGRPLPSLPCIT